MATKGQPSKQRRQTQNQRQRAALEARRTNAAAGPATAGDAGDAPSSSSSGGGSLFSRLRGAQASGHAVRTGTTSGPPVGYRAALSALLAGVAGAVVGAFLITIPVNVDGKPVATVGAVAGEWSLAAWDQVQEAPSDTPAEIVDAIDDWMPNGTERYGIAYFPLSLTLLLPVVGAALAFRSVNRRASAKVVNRTVYVTLFGTLLSGQLPVFLPTVGGVIFAAFQVRKAEIAAQPPPSDDPPDDDVIDVTEVDDADADDAAVIETEVIEAEVVDDAPTDGDQRSV